MLVLLIALAAGAVAAAAAISGILELPLTNHASFKHAGETWNAEKIRDYIGQGKCTPKQYVCLEDDLEIVYCTVDEGADKVIGLIIGYTKRIIITGFMANGDYWRNRCSH